jgi:hypothetical protein
VQVAVGDDRLQRKALYKIGSILIGMLLVVGMILDTYGERSISSLDLDSLHNLEAWSKFFIQEMENPSESDELNVEIYADIIRDGIQFLTPSWITTFLTITGVFLLAWFSYKVGVLSK